MTPPVLFAVQAALIIAGPPLVWHALRLRALVPLAVFQIMAGILLGPSLLGRIAPGLFAALFPPAGFPPLAAVANFAVILYAAVLGMHIDWREFARRGPTLLAVGAGSVVGPVALGVLSGCLIANLFPASLGPHADLATFAAGTGICIGVTALPVLAAILAEMGQLDTRFGRFALNCAALNDAALWLLLAVLLAAVAQGSVALILAETAAYLAVIALVLRPALAALSRRDLPGELTLAIAGGVVLCSAAATEALGIHAIIGAVIAGATLPPAWRPHLLSRMETLTAVVLLPFFFALTGLRTTIDFASPAFGGILLIATAAALAGKLAGTALPARLTGETWRDGLALGSLLGSKGLMEVIALTVLLDAGVIAPATFSAMVAMAIVTTLLAGPGARLAWSLGRPRRELETGPGQLMQE